MMMLSGRKKKKWGGGGGGGGELQPRNDSMLRISAPFVRVFLLFEFSNNV